MNIERDIEGDVYKKLIDYVFRTCNYFSVTYRLSPNHTDEFFKKVLKACNYNEKKFYENFSYKLIGKLFDRVKDNEIVYDEEYHSKFEKHLSLTEKAYKAFIKSYKDKMFFKEKYEEYGIAMDFDNMNFEEFKTFSIYDRKLDILSSMIGVEYYNFVFNDFINKYRKKIVGEIEYRDSENKDKVLSIKCFFKLDEDMKKELLKRKSIYDWIYPMSPEDIAFYRASRYFLYSISHESMLSIYYESKDEYEYLKSLGIEFKYDKYVPINEKNRCIDDFVKGKVIKYF